jgi:2-polyprenyl-3-methyl-5-hydroxy-6-metoxy-1,4-benzoquinol methylase
VGCGSGELACAAAAMGVPSTGVDFAAEMIGLAQKSASRAKLRDARFVCSSIFEFDPAGAKFDVISANGFIEYVSLEELKRFLSFCRVHLAPGGSLVLGSRNRLFNVISMNAYTRDEIKAGDVDALLRESVALASGGTLRDLAHVKPAALQKPFTRHPSTGIRVATRFQYTPVQLARIAKAGGFALQAVSPIHIHGAPPAFRDAEPRVHTLVSNTLQSHALENPLLVPFASSFMLHLKKRG